MKKLNDIKMKPKLILILLISALLPLSVIGIFSIKLSTDALMKAAFNQLTSVRELKHAEIKKYFTKTKHDLQVLVDTVTIFQKQSFNVLEAAHDNKIVTLNRYFTNTFRNIHTLSISSNIENLLASLLELSELNSSENKGDFDTESERYRAIVATQDSYLKKYGENLGYRNILVIKADSGQVIYTTAADKDKGTNLRNGPYSNSGLAEIWRKTVAEKKDSIVDFTNYEPAGGEPMMFIGSPITSGSTVTGILVAEISVAPINEIMHERAGLGRTGEIYVVGTDLLLRTDSALHGEKFNVKQSFKDPDKYRINIEAVEMALSGKDSSDLTTGYNGTSTLSTFSSIKIKDLTWAVIGEMEAEEAYSPRDEQGKEFYKDYIDRYGFYDLYLIRSDGYCFYSAAREADYQTNFLNGKYSNYNLGTLFKRVTNSRQMGIADFAPYAPSNNAPAAFIAQPVIHPLDNEVEIVIALQLPL
ncbi:MAG: cache domain-containing protein, partial [Desulfobulbaceae bacterium]|nr:cache domain-containing protein [Desulfobulbaceae bacterium]